MTAPASILWLRKDLRLADNPALAAAAQRGGPVLPVFIWSPEEEAPWPPGSASRWWLHQSLAALAVRLRELGSRLIIRRGPTLESLRALVQETGAGAVFWNRCYEPAVIARDATVMDALRHAGLVVESFNAALLHEPWTIQNQSGQPFRVFTPFWKHCLAKPDPASPAPVPRRLPALVPWPKSLALDELELEPKINWVAGLRVGWQPWETGATACLRSFLTKAFDSYADQRNRPDVAGTSRLSPHLHFGEISPRQVWQGLRRRAAKCGLPVAQWRCSPFLAEVGWREFAHHLLFHFPHTATEPLRADFKKFPWRKDAVWLCAWQQGRTGYPLVDAGLRELWATGWMHNRVRMIVASFLVKDLLQRGRKAPDGFGTHWWTPTWRRIPLAGNGLRVAVRTPLRISGCSIRPAKGRSLIRRGITFAAGVRNWGDCPTSGCTNRGKPRRKFSPAPASFWAATIPNPSSVMPARGRSLWRHLRRSKAGEVAGDKLPYRGRVFVWLPGPRFVLDGGGKSDCMIRK